MQLVARNGSYVSGDKNTPSSSFSFEGRQINKDIEQQRRDEWVKSMYKSRQIAEIFRYLLHQKTRCKTSGFLTENHCRICLIQNTNHLQGTNAASGFPQISKPLCLFLLLYVCVYIHIQCQGPKHSPPYPRNPKKKKKHPGNRKKQSAPLN